MRNGERGFNAEKICARDEVVGLPEQSEPEGPQGAASGGEANMYCVSAIKKNPRHCRI